MSLYWWQLRILLQWTRGVEDDETNERYYINENSLKISLALLRRFNQLEPDFGQDLAFGGMHDGGIYMAARSAMSIWIQPDRHQIMVWPKYYTEKPMIIPMISDPDSMAQQVWSTLINKPVAS